MKKIEDFKIKTLNQIRLWAWAAAVLPITALAGLFFVWTLGDNTLFGVAMVTGETIMFAIAVTWWWWALYVLRNLVRHWDETREDVKSVLTDIKDVREIVVDLLKDNK